MTRVDLDELEQIARSEDASVILEMIAELRAAREVVEAGRQQYGPRVSLRIALEDYDKAVGR